MSEEEKMIWAGVWCAAYTEGLSKGAMAVKAANNATITASYAVDRFLNTPSSIFKGAIADRLNAMQNGGSGK